MAQRFFPKSSAAAPGVIDNPFKILKNMLDLVGASSFRESNQRSSLSVVDRMTISKGAVRVLEEHLTAFNTTFSSKTWGPKGKEILGALLNEIEPIFQDITSIAPAKSDYSSQIQESFQKCIKKILKEEIINEKEEENIQSQIHQQRGILADPVVENRFTEAGVKFIETISIVPMGNMSGSYLEQLLTQKGLQQGNEALIATTKSPPSLRVSANKKEENLQAIAINLQRHELKVEKGKPEVIMRSGAPCTHGREYNGKKCSLGELEDLRKGKADKTERANIQKEIDIRIGCSTAQALPKVLASIKEMMSDPTKRAIAMRTGTFLHVEQSFLSHLDKSEHHMIQEERAAFKNITENLQVRFGDAESLVVRTDGKIIVTLKKEAGKNDTDDRTFSVLAPLFLQGVNEKQSLGNLVGKVDPLQDDINTEGYELLKTYILNNFSYGQSTPEIEELSRHFHGSQTQVSKDVSGMLLIQDVTRILGGMMGINCKSGKDRTGMVFCYMQSRKALEVFKGKGGEVLRKAEEYAKKVQDKLSEGLSYYVTGLNTGKKDGYSFNPFQRMFLPEWFNLKAKLCANVKS